jgi:membrane dipeptidase
LTRAARGGLFWPEATKTAFDSCPRGILVQRRTFLKTAGVAAATGALPFGVAAAPVEYVRATAPRIRTAAPRTPFPYVDGLTFFSRDVADIAASGLSAFIYDASAAEEVETPDGSPRWFRSFEACARSITARRRSLATGEVPGAFLATRGSDIPSAHAAGRTAVFLQFQGAEPIGEKLDRLDLFYELGLRLLQVTHHHDNAWAGGALEQSWSGLTSVGHEGIERLDELSIIPDLSHVADPACRDVLRVSRRPVIISHGAARALVPSARCTPDDVIRGVADSGGAMGIFMMSFWLTTDPVPTVDAYVRQIRHVVNVGGMDAAAVANDYPVSGEAGARAVGNDNAHAVKAYMPWWDSIAARGVLGFDRRPEHVVIPELNHVRRMFDIHTGLERARFTAAEIEKIMGGNWVRVLTEALG